jgi:hypothetical protein
LRISLVYFAQMLSLHNTCFFECCVATVMWRNLSEICGKEIRGDFESIASLWLCSKKFKTLNIYTSAVLWALWKMRNSLCFQVNQWCGMQVVFCRCAKMLRRWCIMQKEDVASQLEEVAKEWKRRGSSPPVLPCPPSLCQDARTAWPDEEYFTITGPDDDGRSNLLVESLGEGNVVSVSDVMTVRVGSPGTEFEAVPAGSVSGHLATARDAELVVLYK